VTTLRSSLSTYVSFVYKKLLFPVCFVNSSLEAAFQIALVYMHTSVTPIEKPQGSLVRLYKLSYY
jgi:hypothetical protein